MLYLTCGCLDILHLHRAWTVKNTVLISVTILRWADDSSPITPDLCIYVYTYWNGPMIRTSFILTSNADAELRVHLPANERLSIDVPIFDLFKPGVYRLICDFSCDMHQLDAAYYKCTGARKKTAAFNQMIQRVITLDDALEGLPHGSSNADHEKIEFREIYYFLHRVAQRDKINHAALQN